MPVHPSTVVVAVHPPLLASVLGRTLTRRGWVVYQPGDDRPATVDVVVVSAGEVHDLRARVILSLPDGVTRTADVVDLLEAACF